ncbi:MAG: hypothetical protein RL514_4711 [Verrucomicrobiota bacterium]|jgi:hypothetical protein
MEDWTDIRERVLAGKVSKRAILRETGMHWKTLQKILTHSEPPGYRQRKTRPKQKLGPYQARIEQILKEDQLRAGPAGAISFPRSCPDTADDSC